MKVSAVAALFAISLASPLIGGASEGSGTGTVRGSFEGATKGAKLYCTGVYLIPRSPDIDRRVADKFGNVGEGKALQPVALADGRSSLTRRQPPPGGQGAKCRRSRFTQKFAFNDVQAGEYYVTMTASPATPLDDQKLRGKTVELMQRVVVAPGRSAAVTFAHID